MKSSGGQAAPDVTAIVGTAWGIASDIVGWYIYDEQRDLARAMNKVGVFLDQNLLRDKNYAIIWRMDITRATAIAKANWDKALAAYKAGWDDGGRALGCYWRTLYYLRGMADQGLELSDPVPPYKRLFDPSGDVAPLVIEDSGFYAAQGRTVLPPLDLITDKPIVPTWAAAGGAAAAGLAAGAAGWILGGIAAAGSQFVRVQSTRRMTCDQFLSLTERGQRALRDYRDAGVHEAAMTAYPAAYRERGTDTRSHGLCRMLWTFDVKGYRRTDKLGVRTAAQVQAEWSDAAVLTMALSKSKPTSPVASVIAAAGAAAQGIRIA